MATNITNAARRLFREYDIITPPIDVYSIAKKLGIRIVFEDLDDDVSGFLMIKDARATIAVNKYHHSNRQRFTTAHEIGHYVLHRNSQEDNLFVDKKVIVLHRDQAASSGIERTEIQANRFAAELLMPKFMLERELEGSEIDLSDDMSVYRLAKKFGVSEQALGIRLMNLGFISM